MRKSPFFFLVFLSFQFYDVGRALAIQNNQKQSINAKKTSPKTKKLCQYAKCGKFYLKKMLFTENLMNGGSLKRDGIAAFKIQYYSSANSPTVSLLTQSLE